MSTMSAKEFKFFKELSSIPMITCGVHIGINFYNTLKKCNNYVENGLSFTEDMVATITSAPTFKKMTQSLEGLDRLAADGLEMLEQKYPSILITPEELKGEAKRQMIVLKDVGAKKFDGAVHQICRQRKYGMERAFTFFEAMIGPKVSIYVDLLERKIDDYLPPIDTSAADELVLAPRKDEKVLVRMAYIPRTVQDRLVQRYRQYVLKVTWTNDEDSDEDSDADLDSCEN